MGELQDKARNEYGITNADDMSETQLKAEMKAIDDQPKTADGYEATKKAAPAKANKTAAEKKADKADTDETTDSQQTTAK